VKIFQYFLITLFFIGCEEDIYYPYPCKDGKCDSVFFVDEPVGDSLKVFVKVIFNSDIGERVEMEHVLDIIID